MKTAYKVTEFTEGKSEKPVAYCESLDEAKANLPTGFIRFGTLKLQEDSTYYEVTKFYYPDPIADMDMAWEQREIIQVLYFYHK